MKKQITDFNALIVNSKPCRIHVERAIARLKTFGIINFLYHYDYKYINKILVILCFSVNMFPPLIACPEVNFNKSDFDENTELGPLTDDDEEALGYDLDEVLRQFEDEMEPNPDQFLIDDEFIADPGEKTVPLV